MSGNLSLVVALAVALLTALGAVSAAVIGSRTARVNGREDRGLKALEAVLDEHQARITALTKRDIDREAAYEFERKTRRDLEDRVTSLARELADTQRKAEDAHSQALRVTSELGSLRQSETRLTLQNGQLKKRVEELETRLARYEALDGTPIAAPVATTTRSVTTTTTTPTAPTSGSAVGAYADPVAHDDAPEGGQ